MASTTVCAKYAIFGFKWPWDGDGLTMGGGSHTKPYLITDLSRFVQTHQVPQLQTASTNVSAKDAIWIHFQMTMGRIEDG